MIKDGTVVNADISASAAIGLSKLATGALPSGITVASSNIVDGTIVNADINASAAIVDTKLATISTAGKVSNSATTATSSNTANAIVTRDASGNFTAGTITANLSGNVTGNLTGTASAIADNTVTSAKIVDGTIVNADVNASAAIAGTKISPNFGSQNVVTTGTSTAASLIPTGSSVPTNGVYLPAANSVGISTNGTGRLFVDASGRVGIGVSAPDHSLQLNGATATTLGVAIAPNGWNLRHRFSVPTAGNEAVISCNYNGSTVDDAVYATSSATFSPGLIRFATNGVNTAPTERMRLDSSGRLGLGTSSPATSLHVAGLATVRVEASGDSTFPGYQIRRINAVSNTDRNWITYLRTDGRLAIKDETANVDRFVIDTSGNVGIGTTSPSQSLQVNGNALIGATPATQYSNLTVVGDSGIQSAAPLFNLTNAAGSTRFAYLQHTGAGGDLFLLNQENGALRFGTNNAERARIDSSGRLLVGTSTARSIEGNTQKLQVEGASVGQATLASFVFGASNSFGPIVVIGKSRSDVVAGVAVVSNGDSLGTISFNGADGTDLDTPGASISAQVDGTPGANDMPGRLVFSTTADGGSSPTERMRITNAGNVLIGATAIETFFDGTLNVAGRIHQKAAQAMFVWNTETTGARILINLGTGSTFTSVGSISTDGSTTSYNTSSDYRLKENVVPLTGAADRLNQLQVKRFNFIADPDKTFDGFIAHEAQAVVPECVTGTKDEVDDDGNPVYQGIDQSKLVPLLTAALQEAIAEIASLKDRVAALEAS
jgi:hypothetical protein